MKEILRITIGLTISCLIAAFVMGSVFTVTNKAKKHNEHMDLQNTMLGLLGYSKSRPAPPDLKLHPVYRYIIEDGEARYLGYMVPVRKNGRGAYELLVVDLEGKLRERSGLNISPEQVIELGERETALREVLKPPKRFYYADSFIVATLGKRRLAYLLPGEFPGFKTFIRVMLALSPSFEITGLEILEQEEDPGLGGEIVQDYFKNQFVGKSFKKLKALKVVKKPLPEEYRRYLEREKYKDETFTKDQIEQIQQKYRDADIYALTGATISSKAVTNGVKNVVKKFAYREKMLERIMTQERVLAAF
ncbi:MAG: FMN-binding protein [Deltaproteobacteria bacterium]|nr:MAG: FMN-binding protein [Deltaproteobacteria bacterium]